jgi:hypothetical protein
MSRPDCAFAFSQARLQARLGSRPTAADWQRLHATRDLGGLLQTAGTTALAPWTRDLTTSTPVHEAERKLRRRWLACVDEVTPWQPAAWRDAVAWLRWLPYLPALQKLARGGKSPEWMRSDPVLGPIVAEDPRQRAASLQHMAFAPLAAGFAVPPDVAGAWLRHWRKLWPAHERNAQAVERVLTQVIASRAEIAAAAESAASSATLGRLERRLLVAFRRNPLSPVATIAWLGLTALDLMQVRGSVALRALPGADEQRA